LMFLVLGFALLSAPAAQSKYFFNGPYSTGDFTKHFTLKDIQDAVQSHGSWWKV
jgi:hypothetical protein